MLGAPILECHRVPRSSHHHRSKDTACFLNMDCTWLHARARVLAWFDCFRMCAGRGISINAYTAHFQSPGTSIESRPSKRFKKALEYHWIILDHCLAIIGNQRTSTKKHTKHNNYQQFILEKMIEIWRYQQEFWAFESLIIVSHAPSPHGLSLQRTRFKHHKVKQNHTTSVHMYIW